MDFDRGERARRKDAGRDGGPDANDTDNSETSGSSMGGIGISEEFQKHIFEPFTREESATVSGIQGTGLGLAISKTIMDMMGGDISVESEAGRGSEFVVSLECAVGEAVEGAYELASPS